MKAIRGAITVADNTAKDINDATFELINEIVKKNNCHNPIVIICSQTVDLTAAYAVTQIRKSNIFKGTKYFSCTEPDIVGSLKKCIRLLILINEDITPKDIYLKGAKDLITEDN